MHVEEALLIAHEIRRRTGHRDCRAAGCVTCALFAVEDALLEARSKLKVAAANQNRCHCGNVKIDGLCGLCDVGGLRDG